MQLKMPLSIELWVNKKRNIVFQWILIEIYTIKYQII